MLSARVLPWSSRNILVHAMGGFGGFGIGGFSGGVWPGVDTWFSRLQFLQLILKVFLEELPERSLEGVTGFTGQLPLG